MKILLRDILEIRDPRKYKLHLACKNDGGIEPLDDYIESYSKWLGWNEWRRGRNVWTRKYIFSLIEFYPQTDAWLFGGVFEVIKTWKDGYTIKAEEDFEKFRGRLLVSFHRYKGLRGRSYNLENHIDNFEVKELFPQPYMGEHFCGYEHINHDFPSLELVFKNEAKDWKGALSNIKGVYLIIDKSNGKKYVGSAYGGSGIWSRWACYIGTGHGWNDELTRIIRKKGMDYARKNFKFSLLDIMNMKTPDELVIARESYWKNVLLARGQHGYNKN